MDSCKQKKEGANLHPLYSLVSEKDYLTKTLSSMSFSTFGKRNKLVYFVLRSLNENLLSVYDINTSFE